MFCFKKNKKEPKMIKVDISRCYDNDWIPVRCICGHVPLLLRTDPNFPSVVIKCDNPSCTIGATSTCIFGRTTRVAIRMWNDMIKEKMEE